MTSLKRFSNALVLTICLGAFASVCPTAPAATLLIEAENFNETGGWVADSQFMDIMGSPYLLAHGLGHPVGDASTTVKIAENGNYRLWVRTKDWVAPWKAPGTPGRFQALINGQAVKTTFGTERADWHWQEGGRITLSAGTATIALHDMSGFEGRCDAILLSTDANLVPPNHDPEMATWRRQLLGYPEKPEARGDYDLVVVGGGMAGTCAAISGARLGLRVALVQDRPVLGGNNSSEVRVWLQGARNVEPWSRVGDIVAELEPERRAHYGPANTAELYEDEKKLNVARAEPNLTLLLNHRAIAAENAKNTIQAVIAQDTKSGRRFRLTGRWFADCTGDAALGFLAGAEFDMSPKGRMGPCNLWNVMDTGAPVSFPRCPWALDLAKKPFPGRDAGKPDPLKLGGWYWESGFDRDPFADMEYVRDWNFRAMYGAWDAIKNVDRTLPNHALNWSAHVMGKRESRRLMGDIVLNLADLKEGRDYPDGCVPTGWKVDLHLPDPRYEKGFEGDAFISKAEFGAYPMPFWIPYRCLYSRNIGNLFMAGRDISVTHEALGAVRVMRTGGCMGEIVGMAASLCRKHDCTPRNVYERYLPELQGLMRQGVGRTDGSYQTYLNQGAPVQTKAKAAALPDWLKAGNTNLLFGAQVTVSGSKDAAQNPPALLTDGKAKVTDNNGRWLSDTQLPHWVEFVWPQPVRISAVRVISGYHYPAQKNEGAPITDFSFQIPENRGWRTIPGAAATGNDKTDWAARFPAVQTQRLRLIILQAPGNISRIWEIEAYDLPPEK